MHEEAQLALAGLEKVYDYTQYSHKNQINVIPEAAFKQLVEDTFRTIADVLRNTYGPYGSTVVISEQSETTTTKDGYNVFNAIGFSHVYKRMVYLAIKKIIDRVNSNVGDGTTSCILLAEKMFRAIENEGTLQTVDARRNILSVLTRFEEMLQDHSSVVKDKEDALIHPLTCDALSGLIDMAGNYDDKLTSIIESALCPTSKDGVIESVRNVVSEPKLDQDVEGSTNYEIDYLPGDYRIRVNMASDTALLFETQRPIRVALYDHAFSSSDWEFFMQNFDKETETLIIARSFSMSFMGNEFAKYIRDRKLVKRPVPTILCEIKGDYLRDEIKDLAAVLGIEPIGLHAKAVEHEKLPCIPVQVYKGNCMCFDVETIPEQYIKNLEAEMDADLSGSMVRHQLYKDRIRALSCNSNDTLITVKSSSSLELKMISDKIDDCISIVNSSLEYGIVPNMFSYGYWRIMLYKHEHGDEMTSAVADSIMKSIRGLFEDIWQSKHGLEYQDKQVAIANELYSKPTDSFDIIRETYAPIEALPTSAQYDLEVIAAAISIVKYLLSSRALVFDAHLLKQVDDTGTYQQL